MKLKLTIEYAGTRYSGWQVQKNARTVQGEMHNAIREAGAPAGFELYGAGRTDAGVHATGQVAHLDVSMTLPPDMLRRRINDALPSDINVLRAERVPHRFHARHDAVARSYVYQIARRRTAFGKAYVWWVKDDVNIGQMRQAAAAFTGMHDFRSFAESDPAGTSTRVLVERLDIREEGDLLLVHIEGSHFLWKMVRRVVGVLVEVGRGAMTSEEAAALLDSRSGAPARLTAPASGLFLHRVYYPGDRRDAAVRPLIELPRYV